MILACALFRLLLAAISLEGVKGDKLTARAYFDANNVKVGDPMILTIDFVGNADFAALHPPALSRFVDRRDWKLDDVSAKTDTFRDARRLTYRVRPMREGVLWFPAFEFEFAARDGQKRRVRSNDIPVHAKGGVQVVVEGMGEDLNKMPEPAPLVTDVTDENLSEDDLFAWRKACSHPTADAFAAFGFPAAKLNEARCAVLEGNWARALKVYSRLEWRIGQTPEIERGIVAALALRYDNPLAELPVWRQVARPVLRYGWLMRALIVFGSLACLALVFWLAGRAVRLVACLAFVIALAPAAGARDMFAELEEMAERTRQQMNSVMSGGFGGMQRMEPPKVLVTATTNRQKLQVGEPFEFIISLEIPRSSSFGQLNLQPSETFGMTVLGRPANLTDAKSANPTNVIKRISVPVRYDVPFCGEMTFAVSGMITGRQESGGGRNRFSFSFSNSFTAESTPFKVDVKPLSTVGQPADFSGIISQGLSAHELLDALKVETNDVIQITYRLRVNGYVPEDWMPEGAAFSMGTTADGIREWRRYFVADGAAATPKLRVSYYDPRERKYKTAETGGTHVQYR